MQIVIFSHPDFLNSQSMPLFAGMIYKGMIDRGHKVEVWKPLPWVYRLPAPQAMKKWLGYVDQYVLFPLQVRMRLRHTPDDTLFVFADQALGPWVPLVKDQAACDSLSRFYGATFSAGPISAKSCFIDWPALSGNDSLGVFAR